MRRFGTWGWIAVLAALLCCGVMAWLTAARMASTVEAASEAALDEVGLGGVVDYAGIEGFDGIGRDGLNVELEGPASAEQAAVDAVRGRSEVDQVSYRVTGESALDVAETDAESEADDGAESAPDTEDEPGSERAQSSAGLDATVVTATATAPAAINLEGTVPDTATRDALITAAVNEYGAANVTHDLVVDAEAVTLEGGRLVLVGDAISDEEQSAWVELTSAVAAARRARVRGSVRDQDGRTIAQ